MSKHTPGPWAVRPGYSVVAIVGADGFDVAVTRGPPYWKAFSPTDAAPGANLTAQL